MLARHRKANSDEYRGRDIFGKISTQSESNSSFSAEFLRHLLYYISVWGKNFGIAPNGKNSGFLTHYEKLKKEGVVFPLNPVEEEAKPVREERA